jgi:hypothetical protein
MDPETADKLKDLLREARIEEGEIADYLEILKRLRVRSRSRLEADVAEGLITDSDLKEEGFGLADARKLIRHIAGSGRPPVPPQPSDAPATVDLGKKDSHDSTFDMSDEDDTGGLTDVPMEEAQPR